MATVADGAGYPSHDSWPQRATSSPCASALKDVPQLVTGGLLEGMNPGSTTVPAHPGAPSGSPRSAGLPVTISALLTTRLS